MTKTVSRPWRDDPAGLKVLVRVTPKSAREGIEGTVETAHGVALAVRVRAAPQDGDANRAVMHAIAGWLGVARSGITLISGPRSRVKTVLVAGEPARLAALLQARLGSSR